MITGIQIYTSEAFSAATTIKFTIGATDLCSAVTVTSGNVYTVTPTASAAVAALFTNVGTTDAIITYTATKGSTLTTGALTVIVSYIVLASNGTALPASA